MRVLDNEERKEAKEGEEGKEERKQSRASDDEMRTIHLLIDAHATEPG